MHGKFFWDYAEKIAEVLFKKFVSYGTSFDHCIYNLKKVLQPCKESNLMLNWELCHFMIRKKIIFGQRVYEKGRSLDEWKVEIMTTRFKRFEKNQGHKSFYRIFSKDFAKLDSCTSN
jgi:hypothetical protein